MCICRQQTCRAEQGGQGRKRRYWREGKEGRDALDRLVRKPLGELAVLEHADELEDKLVLALEEGLGFAPVPVQVVILGLDVRRSHVERGVPVEEDAVHERAGDPIGEGAR